MTPAQLRQAAAQAGLDCSAGRHVARLGDPCVGCGDPGPPLAPLRKFELRPLARATAPRSPDTVEVLEGLLVEARAGRIDGIAVAYTFRDGGVGTVWDFDAGANLPALVGAGAALQFRLARALAPDALELDSDDPDQESLDE